MSEAPDCENAHGSPPTCRANCVTFLRDGTLADDVDAVTALDRLRGGGRVSEVAAGDVYPVVQVAIEGASQNISAVADVQLTVAVGGSSTVLRLSYLVVVGQSQVRAKVESWLESHRDLLRGYNTSVDVGDLEQWRLPSSEELQWLVYISAAPAPPEEHFGPPIVMRALRQFDDGNVAAAAELFRQMIWHRESSSMRNNYAYCLLVLGEYEKAIGVLQEIPTKEQTYMVRHNRAVLEILTGSVQSGVAGMELLWKDVQEERAREKLDAYSMLTLDERLDTVTSRAGLPVDAAVVLNLVILGRLEDSDAALALEKQYPDKYRAWVSWAKEAGLKDGTQAPGAGATE